MSRASSDRISAISPVKIIPKEIETRNYGNFILIIGLLIPVRKRRRKIRKLFYEK